MKNDENLSNSSFENCHSMSPLHNKDANKMNLDIENNNTLEKNLVIIDLLSLNGKKKIFIESIFYIFIIIYN